MQAAQDHEINGVMFDRYTFGHVASGVLMGLGSVPWWLALTLSIGWEVAERPLKGKFPRVFPSTTLTSDSWANMFGDVAALMAGWAVMRYYEKAHPR